MDTDAEDTAQSAQLAQTPRPLSFVTHTLMEPALVPKLSVPHLCGAVVVRNKCVSKWHVRNERGEAASLGRKKKTLASEKASRSFFLAETGSLGPAYNSVYF